jgi:glycosyltransferase involved in cell wall biosynthesis
MVFSKIDHFIVHADQNKVRLITDYKIHENQVHVVPHGTFGYFTKWKNESKEELRKEFDIKDEKVILFFGYIREYKGLKYLLKALSEVIKDNPKIKLIVAGELWQDWSEYEDIIKKNNLKDHVQIFPNYINDKEVHKFFDLADIVVLPYYNSEQTISGPLLVSLAFGKPTIVSPVGGIKQFVNDEKEVIFSEPGNVDELSNNIKRLLKDNELQKRLSDNALIADKNHQWNAVANHTVELYKKIMRD